MCGEFRRACSLRGLLCLLSALGGVSFVSGVSFGGGLFFSFSWGLIVSGELCLLMRGGLVS